MPSPRTMPVFDADRIANRICRRRLMNASLVMAAAWLTYVNPFNLHVRADAPWPWLTTVIAVTALALGYAWWSVTSGDRRAWMHAFETASHEHAEAGSPD